MKPHHIAHDYLPSLSPGKFHNAIVSNYVPASDIHSRGEYLRAQPVTVALLQFPSGSGPVRTDPHSGSLAPNASRRAAPIRTVNTYSPPNSIPTTALGPRSFCIRASAQATGHFDADSVRSAQTLEGRGPVKDWTDGRLAVRAVIYRARAGASYRAPFVSSS